MKMKPTNLISPLLYRQAIIAVVALVGCVAATYFINPARVIFYAQSLGFGIIIGIITTIITARFVLKSARAATEHPGMAMLPVYSGMIWKLAMMAGGAYVAFARLNLAPIFVILGYLVMQSGYIWFAFSLKDSENND